MFTLLMDFGNTASKAIKAGVEEGKKPHAKLEDVARVILGVTKTWIPKHAGKEILTPNLRTKLTQALAELSYNIAAAETKKPLL